MGFITVYTRPCSRSNMSQTIYLLQEHQLYDELTSRILSDPAARQRFQNSFPGKPFYVLSNESRDIEDEIFTYAANAPEYGLFLDISRFKDLPPAHKLTFAFHDMVRIEAIRNYLMVSEVKVKDSRVLSWCVGGCDLPLGCNVKLYKIFEFENEIHRQFGEKGKGRDIQAVLEL